MPASELGARLGLAAAIACAFATTQACRQRCVRPEDCARGELCGLSGRCLSACEQPLDCPADIVCVGGSCVARRRGDDAGTPAAAGDSGGDDLPRDVPSRDVTADLDAATGLDIARIPDAATDTDAQAPSDASPDGGPVPPSVAVVSNA
jgi:hypothetical protein